MVCSWANFTFTFCILARLQYPTAVLQKIQVIWDAKPCRLVNSDTLKQCFSHSFPWWTP